MSENGSPHGSTATTRRQMLARSGAVAAGIAFTGALSELFAGTSAAQSLGHHGYGDLVPDPDGLLDLPKGFRYTVLSKEGDQLRSGEGPVPSNHDGMAAFADRQGHVHLVRNHENRATGRVPVPVVDGLTYDPQGKGGCTALTLDRGGRVLSERVAIAGTAVNCAGGPTPWKTWLTCEETEDRAGTNGYTKDHGFIFEVDGADPRRTGAVPLTAMGRFAHEAIAVDPHRGVVYETEDAFERPFGLFYRFLPNKPLGGTALAARAAGSRRCGRPGCPTCPRSRRPAPASTASSGWTSPTRWPSRPPLRHQDFGAKGIDAQKRTGCLGGRPSTSCRPSPAPPTARPQPPTDEARYDPDHRRPSAGRRPGPTPIAGGSRGRRAPGGGRVV
ncbi:Tat pathway signal sequence domain protein OS=Streptomyces albaduncus OX=68172 GN=FHS32_001403 PE=4 SV=1 [Streptomyces griseoloalbus]